MGGNKEKAEQADDPRTYFQQWILGLTCKTLDSCVKWMLGTKLTSSGRVVCASTTDPCLQPELFSLIKSL